MKKNILSFSLVFTIFLIFNPINAQDNRLGAGITSDSAFAIQANICRLNEGISMERYEALNERYFNWAKKNDVETFLALQTPHFQHGDFNNPPSYDFVEFMAAPFETHGKGWDKLTETKEGQDILNEWGEVSTCYMKMNSAYFNYANEEALNEGDSRYAEWNWCSIRDGKSPDDLIAFHNKAAARMEENPNGAIGWLTMVPLLGGANYPTFAHVVLFPDMESVMQSKKVEAAEGGWRFRDEYETEYAECSDPMLMHEKVYNRPK